MWFTRLKWLCCWLLMMFWSFRLLSHSGVYPDYTTEPTNLASGRSNVKNVTLLLSDWWGSGIVHTKVWISDRRDVYIGSANNDWKSLTQVHWETLLLCKFVLVTLYGLLSCSSLMMSCCWTVAGEGTWNLSCWLSENSQKGWDLLWQPMDTCIAWCYKSHNKCLRSTMADW